MELTWSKDKSIIALMYFPVVVPYRTSPVMNKNTGSIVEPVENKIINTNLKSYELGRFKNLWACRRGDLVEQACDVMGVPRTDHIVTYALNFKEDVAIMHDGVLVSICFCYPSSWIPAHRVGKTLTEIHAPVADGDMLRKMSQRIAEAMATQDSFRRHVWTISTTGELSNHPNIVKPEVTDSTGIDDLYFRLETQTTKALGDGRTSLFFVNVETCPLREFWNNIEQRQIILDSVNSMSDGILEYKNLVKIKKVLNNSIAV